MPAKPTPTPPALKPPATLDRRPAKTGDRTRARDEEIRVKPAVSVVDAVQRIAADPRLEAEFRRAPFQTLIAISSASDEELEPKVPRRVLSRLVPCLLTTVVLATIGCTLAVALVDDESRALIPLVALAFLGLIPLAVMSIMVLWRELAPLTPSARS